MEEQKLLNKVVIFVFFAHKKYPCSFITLWLNHWCHKEYFNNVFLDRGRSIAVYGRVRKLSDFIKNILICVQKINKGLRVWNDMRRSI